MSVQPPEKGNESGQVSRGRPPVARANDPLLIELRRLTGCGAKRLAKSLGRIQARGGLEWLHPVTPEAASRAFRGANREIATRPEAVQGVLPGWCAAHVIPLRLASGDRCDLALLWEPFSHAVLADVSSSFAKPGKLAAFVARALRKLPLPLEERIETIRITKPLTASTPHWTIVSEIRAAALERGDFLRDDRLVPFDEDETTGPLHEVAVPFNSKYDVLEAATIALNTHNLNPPDGKGVLVLDRHVISSWREVGGPIFGNYFWRKGGVLWPPERRLVEALGSFETFGQPWEELDQIGRRLSYRSSG